MLRWAVTFFVVAIVAALFGFTRIAGSAMGIAKILFFKNPLSEVDPTIKSIYLNQTSEFTGLFSAPNNSSKITIAYWAMTLPGVPISIYLAWCSLKKERQAWIFITLLNIAYIIMSALNLRMITYAALCSLIPISYAIYLPFAFVTQNFCQPYTIIARAALIVTCCFCFGGNLFLFRK